MGCSILRGMLNASVISANVCLYVPTMDVGQPQHTPRDWILFFSHASDTSLRGCNKTENSDEHFARSKLKQKILY